MKTNRSNADRLVQKHHRANRALYPLAIMTSGLALLLGALWYWHPALSPVVQWGPWPTVWAAGAAITFLAAVVLWSLRRAPLLQSAAEVDALLATHNRLEAATALHDINDPLAKAQRLETEKFLQQTRVAPRHRLIPVLWIATSILAMAHIATLICWARPVHEDKLAKQAAPIEKVETNKPAATTPLASIEWHSPEAETTATAIEEVPLEAEAESSSGLSDAVLEVEVNGEHKLSQPLADDLKQPGRHTLKLSMYLDQLDVKTYDMIAYHVSAQRVFTGKLPPTSSPVQFVQVRPMREDTFVCAGGDQPSKCFNYVTALKAAQLRLMKDNFTLAHAEVGHENGEWQHENSRVGEAQGELSKRADEVIELMTTNNYPPQILGLVRESQPLMSEAGTKIQKEENQPALSPQGKALGYLTEVEKYLKNSIKLASANKQPPPNDPFKRQKNLELKTHPLTRAGKIDALANEQSRLAGDLARTDSKSGMQLSSDAPNKGDQKYPNEISGTPAERQAKIRQGIGDLLNDPGMAPEALKHLQSSDGLAGKSQEQIEQQNIPAAREPAAEAARELRQTAAILRHDDGQAAKNKLADALLQLGAAAGNVRKSARMNSDAEAQAELKKAEQAVNDAARQLQQEAERQQNNGSTNGAARLNEMAKMLQGESLKQMLAQAQQQPRNAANSEALAQRLDQLAERAAEQRNSEQMSRPELARLVERLQRTQLNLNNLASQCKNPGPTAGQSAASQGSVFANSSQVNQSQNSPSQVQHARAPEMSRDEMRQAQAAQLMDELRLGTMDSRNVVQQTAYLTRLDRLLREAGARAGANPHEFAPLIESMDPPLTGLIKLLQEKLVETRRTYELASKESAQAPPAYRPAVAEYFEEISRDYKPEQGK